MTTLVKLSESAVKMSESVERTMNHDLTHEYQVINAAMGMVNEAAELSDVIKKAYFQGHGFDHQKVVEEMGDMCWYMFLMCRELNIDFRTVLEKNVEKLRKRYPQKFTIEASVNRKE